MKAVIVIVIFFVCLPDAYTQNSPTYNSFINKAEISIIDSAYYNALSFYNKAFTKENKPFARDYYNAALTAVKLKRYVDAGNYLLKLADMGFIIDSLNSRKGFGLYVKSAHFKELKKRIIPGKTIFPVKNYFLRSSIDTLIADDQYFRIRNRGDYMKHEYAGIIKELDSINAYKFIGLINEYGYPNERQIGLYDNQLHTSITNVLIQHQQFGSPTRVVNYTPVILKAIMNGEISANNGIAMYALSAGRDSLFGTGGFFNVQQQDGTYKFAYYKEFKNGLEEKYDMNRAMYNLEPLKDYRRKIIYTLKNNNEFHSDINIGVTIQTLNKEFAKFYKDLTYIE